MGEVLPLELVPPAGVDPADFIPDLSNLLQLDAQAATKSSSSMRTLLQQPAGGGGGGLMDPALAKVKEVQVDIVEALINNMKEQVTSGVALKLAPTLFTDINRSVSRCESWLR